MVHLGFQLHHTFCWLGFPLQACLLSEGKTVIIPHHHPHSLSPVSDYFLPPPLFQWGYRLHPSGPGSSIPPAAWELADGLCCPPQASYPGFVPLPAPLPSPTAHEASCYSFNGFINVYIDLMAEAGRCVGYHKPSPPRAHRQWRQRQDSLPIVIIFALCWDLSHAAATSCLQDTKAMKTRLTKSVCEPFSLV